MHAVPFLVGARAVLSLKPLAVIATEYLEAAASAYGHTGTQRASSQGTSARPCLEEALGGVAETVAGIEAVLKQVRELAPAAKIVVVGLTPRVGSDGQTLHVSPSKLPPSITVRYFYAGSVFVFP